VRRRALLFIAVIGGALIAPFAQAQPAMKVFHIGFFVARGPDPVTDGAFLQGLRDLGYVEGKNIAIERRYAKGKAELLPGLAAEMADMQLDLIVVAPINAALAMKKATRTIPIVMANGGEPVGVGLVANLAHPGGNVTGLSNVSTDLIGKQMELLKETVPHFSRVAFLANGSIPEIFKDLQFRAARAAARSLDARLQLVQASDVQEFEPVFTAIAQHRAQGLVVALDPMFFTHRLRLAELTASHRLPAISAFREFAEAGGLMAYGANLADMFRRSATYVDKILRGANPADLPVEQPTKFDFVINLKTAKMLKLTIPPAVMLRATDVIQ